MNRISRQLGLIFLAFFSLVAVSVAGTAWGLHAQSAEALAINLAGRQRMLIQGMTRLAVEPERSPTETRALAEAQQAFADTLLAFQHGGSVRYPADQIVRLPAARDPALQAQLARLDRGWQTFRLALDTLQSAASTDPQIRAAQAQVRQQSPALLAEADALARQYQAAADRRSARLGRVQGAFFVGASLLLLLGIGVARRSILRPLHSLASAAERIGAGDLETPAPAVDPLEMAALAQTFETMRRDLLAARQALLDWNQTLEDRVTARTRELEALHTVSREISARLEPEAVFRSVTDKARLLLGADTAFLCLLEEDEHLLHLRSHSGPAEAALQPGVEATHPFVRAILCRPAGQGCPSEGSCGACSVMAARYQRSHLAAPLWVEQRRIGALCVGSQAAQAFTADAARLLERLAGAAAAAIENARLYRQAERLSALEERQRIAAAMHDGLAQTLASIGLLVDQAGECLDTHDLVAARQALGQAYVRIGRASGEVRASIASLVEEPPVPAAVQDCLAELVEQARRESPTIREWQIDLPGRLVLPTAAAGHVLGIAQEALANARRHSGAGRIALRLDVRAGEAELQIEDDGCGFDPVHTPEDGRRHFGLKILHARAAHLDGRLEIAAAPGCGTRITLRWPLARPAE